MKKSLAHKPGAERAPKKPDSIKATKVAGEALLLDFLIDSLPDLKKTSVKELLKYNQVMVNGFVTTQFNYGLNPGDEVSVNFTRPFQTFHNPRLKILYEDNDLIVVNKGYGLLSVGTDKGKETTAYSLLYDYLKRKSPANKIFIIHRLDRYTSGVIVFAKSIEAKEKLQHNWNNLVLDRRYIAVTEGRPEPKDGKIESFLKQNSQFVMYSVPEPDEDTKLAVTHYKTLRAKGNYALVELTLATGRKNQIRVHLHDIGCPIAGDRKYGAKSSPIARVALHAQTLRFVHPITRKDMNFNVPYPDKFNKVL